jgi:hypothetical protein
MIYHTPTLTTAWLHENTMSFLCSGYYELYWPLCFVYSEQNTSYGHNCQLRESLKSEHK